MSTRAEVVLTHATLRRRSREPARIDDPPSARPGQASVGRGCSRQPARSCCSQLKKCARGFRRPPDNLRLRLSLSPSGRNRFAPIVVVCRSHRIQHRGWADTPETLILLRVHPTPEGDPAPAEPLPPIGNRNPWRRPRAAQPCFRARSMSRFASRFFMASRLSWSFLPLPTPISSFTRPFSLK